MNISITFNKFVILCFHGSIFIEDPALIILCSLIPQQSDPGNTRAEFMSPWNQTINMIESS